MAIIELLVLFFYFNGCKTFVEAQHLIEHVLPYMQIFKALCCSLLGMVLYIQRIVRNQWYLSLVRSVLESQLRKASKILSYMVDDAEDAIHMLVEGLCDKAASGALRPKLELLHQLQGEKDRTARLVARPVEVGSLEKALGEDEITRRRLRRRTSILNDNTVHILGKGGFGVVYEEDGKAVKLMKVKNDVVLKEIEEFKLMKGLGSLSENILTAESLEEDAKNGLATIRMAKCQGSVTDLVKQYRKSNTGRSQLPEKWILQIVKQAAQGLKVLHDAGYCHLDIKPDNIMLSEFPRDGDDIKGGTVKIADLGLVMLKEEARRLQWSTGTRIFMAPEVAQLNEIVKDRKLSAPGPLSDSYSMAVLMYVLLFGTCPTARTLRAAQNLGQRRHLTSGHLVRLLGSSYNRISMDVLLSLLEQHPLLM